MIRPGDVYGPGSRPWTVLPVELMKRRRFVLPARGRGIHSPVYVDDLVTGIIAAAEAKDAAGQVITLSGGLGVETREFFAYYARMLGRRDVPIGADLRRAWPAPVRRAGSPASGAGARSSRPTASAIWRCGAARTESRRRAGSWRGHPPWESKRACPAPRPGCGRKG